MSHYGPPGGSPPDQPQDPWRARQSPEPYEQPADPWSEQDPWGGSPSSTPPGGGSPASPGSGYGYDPGYATPSSPGYEAGPSYDAGGGPGGTRYLPPDPGYGYAQPPAPAPAPAPGPGPVWSPPAAPARRKSATPLLLTIGVLTLLVLGGVGVGAYVMLSDKDKASPTAQPTAPGGGQTTDQPSGQPSATPGDTGGSSTDARFASKGDCLVNKGTNEKPVMQVSKCAKGTFEVLARFDGTKDYAGKCGGGKVPGYQFFYFFDGELDSSDFVLCLRKRT
jgi:hypothetical protein